MNANRFDTISKLFARRKTRRSAIAGGVGLAAASVASRAFAQDGTPETATPTTDPGDPHPGADVAVPDPEYLFVQPFDGGTWSPKAGEDGVYSLTLTGAAAHTIYFSDRPERIVGMWPTQEFLDALGFSPENPPNAAIVARHEDGEGQEILVIELLNPVWDGNGTLTYDARVLADYGKHGLAHLARQQQDYELDETFGAGSLFIDSIDPGCVDLHVTCYDANDTYLGTQPYPQCHTKPPNLPMCVPCYSPDFMCSNWYINECVECERTNYDFCKPDTIVYTCHAGRVY